MAVDTGQPRLIRAIELGSAVQSVAWSPDGRLLATGDHAHRVSVWTREGRLLWRGEGHTARVWNVAWSPDGRRIASCSEDRTIRVWNAATGTETHRLEGHTGCVEGVSWSPEGGRLASGSHDKTGPNWNITTGAVILCCDSNESFAPVEWSPDGGRIAAGDLGGKLWIWDAASGAEIFCLRLHEGWVPAVRWSPDATRIAAACGPDNSVQVWNASTGERLLRATAPTTWLRDIAWSADGRRLVCCCSQSDNVMRFLDAATGVPLAEVGRQSRVYALALSGGVLASSSRDGTVALWDVAVLVGRAVAAVLGAAGRWLARQAATLGRRAPAALAPPPWVPDRLPPADVAGALGCIGGDAGVMGEMAIGPDGRSVVGECLVSGGRRLRCWRVEDGALLWESREHHTDTIWQLSWSPEGGRIASAGSDTTVGVWDAASGARLFVCRGHAGPVGGVAWSPDGRLLASIGVSNELHLWDAGNGSERGRFSAGGWSAVAWSPDGRLLAAGSERLLVIDAATGAAVWQAAEAAGDVWRVAWSPDGRLVASAHWGGGAVCVWDAGSGALRLRCAGHSDVARDVAWSPDGRFLASGSQDRTTRVWDAATGAELACFTGPDTVWSVAWAPSRAFLLAGHAGHGIYVWDTGFLLDTAPPAMPLAATTAPPAALRPLPAALALLHRLDITPPLSLLHDLRAALGGEPPGPDAPEGWAELLRHPGLQRLIRLRWPSPARTGLIALLLRDIPQGLWAPPPELPPDRLIAALTAALAGEPMPAEAPAPPLVQLAAAAGRVDERLLTLLAALGPQAVAADPGLPLRLLPELARLPRLDDAARRLLGLRLTAQEAGAAQGDGPPGAEPAGLSPRGRLTAVLPWQYALPDDLFDYRAANGGLLYRARAGRAPPRLRPVVLVLDVSPPVFGPVEAMTRPAAHAVATTLRAAGVAVALVTAGGAGTARLADTATAALAALTERSLDLADAVAAMARAETLRRSLRGRGAEPVVLLLSHPWFGAEEPEAMTPPGLRGLFIQYPGRRVRPAWADRCLRHETLPPAAWAQLPAALGRLIA